jgi:hypothetical protein
MFNFDMSKLDARDLADTIRALDYLLEHQPGQDDNPLYLYLLEVLSDEAERRQGADIPAKREVCLPVGEATGGHVWALVVFASSLIKASKDWPSAMTIFFARTIDEIERAAHTLKAATMN